MTHPFFIHPDIAEAETLPSIVYRDPYIFQHLKENLFFGSWQWLGGPEWLSTPHAFTPTTFMPGCIDEPLIVVKDGDQISCLSNVCTHRAKILIEEPCSKPFITCGYHGRCFKADGTFRSMPEFGKTKNFPSKSDNLHTFPVTTWNGLHFAGLHPTVAFQNVIKPVEDHVRHFPFNQLEACPELSKTYHVRANWLTYCDNYLEGFHIPFVHPTLNKAIAYEDYEVRIFDHANVQVARCKPGQKALPLRAGDPDFGQDIYAYYWFIYPNIMLNFYHWGLSVNWVLPRDTSETEIRFLTYKRKDVPAEDFYNTALDLTEAEDEAVVESVQQGLESVAYHRGRFSPDREQGVHAFHRYLFTEVFSKMQNIGGH